MKDNELKAVATVLTDERIEELFMPMMPWLPSKDALQQFARAIESEALAHAGVTAEPAGWKLVPIEPTQEMFNAARTSAAGSGAEKLLMASYWQNMLAAAPTIPAQVPAAEVRAAYEQAAQVVDKLAEQTDLTYKAGILKTAARDIRSLAQQSTADKASEVRAAEWISVEDRLPEDEEPVLTYGAKRTEWAVMHRISGDWHIETASDFHSSYAPKFWMPLPAAPSTADSANTGALGEKGADHA